MTIHVRTTTGLPRMRAGLRFDVAWAAFEVTDEQLALIRADKCLAVREAPRRDGDAGAASEADATSLEAELAAMRARVAELEAENAELRADLEAATAP